MHAALLSRGRRCVSEGARRPVFHCTSRGAFGCLLLFRSWGLSYRVIFVWFEMGVDGNIYSALAGLSLEEEEEALALAAPDGDGSSSVDDAARQLARDLPKESTDGRKKFGSSCLVWIDLEMSGLDPAKDVILQAAVAVTDGSLTRVRRGPEVVVHASDAVLEGMNAWCVEHHGASGLTRACRESELDVAGAEDVVLAFLDDALRPGFRANIAGCSVHKDLAFIEVHMPRLAERLNHRIVDVTSLLELRRRWFPECTVKSRGPTAHTAMDDVLQSIVLLKELRRMMFKNTKGKPW